MSTQFFDILWQFRTTCHEFSPGPQKNLPLYTPTVTYSQVSSLKHWWLWNCATNALGRPSSCNRRA